MLSFFTLSLVSIQQRCSYPLYMEQQIRTEAEKVESKAKKQAKRAKPADTRRKPGRPKGSRNKNKVEVTLNPELQRIQKMLQSLLNTIRGTIQVTYLVLDGQFGNHPVFHMVRQGQLHLISKLRHDAALHFAYVGPKPKRGPTPRLGEQMNVRKIPDQYLKETKIAGGFETRTYQMQLLHEDFPDPLNIVILLRTNQSTGAWSNVILFSSDLALSYDKLVDYLLQPEVPNRVQFQGRQAILGAGGFYEPYANGRHQCCQPRVVYDQCISSAHVPVPAGGSRFQHSRFESTLQRLPLCHRNNSFASTKTR